jgi:hypothetical protein
MEVTSRDVVGSTFFCATAHPGTPNQINIGSGNNQRAETSGPAPEPLRAWVSAACNGVAGVPVTFTVTQGGGTVNGQSEVTIDSSTTGHAEVDFVLGSDQGYNVIEANFSANPGNPATFLIYGVPRDPEQPTTFSGLVLDNSSRPIGGARCVLEVAGTTLPETFTDESGQFSFTDIPAGPAHLHVDGLVATTLAGETIPQGSYPALSYSFVAIPNAPNQLPTPVLLPKLNPNNAVVYDGTQDLELTCEGMEGLKMIVKAGSMRRPDGSVPTPSDPAILSLNQVHHDDIPMPMPDGAAPPFAWTLQPGGATFEPPIQIEYPNMSALPPGAIAYFLSFNHDTERFEIIASGHVVDDGSTIVTDPGVGLRLAGWGCNCPPYTVTADCEDGCDESEEEITELPTVDIDASKLLSGIEQAINSIPKLEASGFGLTAKFSGSVGKECCEEELVTFATATGSVNVTGSIGFNGLPTPEVEFAKTWQGVGSIDARLGASLTPKVGITGTVGAGGRTSGCGACLNLAGSVSLTGSIEAFGGGELELIIEETWLWDETSVETDVSITGKISVTGSAKGDYFRGEGCGIAGFQNGCASLSDVKGKLKLSFKVAGVGYSAESKPVVLITGTEPCP